MFDEKEPNEDGEENVEALNNIGGIPPADTEPAEDEEEADKEEDEEEEEEA